MGIEMSGIEFGDLKCRSLGERAASLLREKIVRGELAPGTRLTEESLSSALGISRPSVKEALMILDSDGLVVRRVRNKFTEVVQFSDQDVDEISTMRCSLEVLAAETCIRKGTIPLSAMRKQVEQIESALDADDVDLAEYVKADFEFHELIVQACGNRRAINAWQCLKSQISMLLYMVVAGKPELTTSRSRVNHNQLLQAFEAQDSARATLLLKEHVGALPVLLGCLHPDH